MRELVLVLTVFHAISGLAYASAADEPPPRATDYDLLISPSDPPRAFRDAALDSFIQSEMENGSVAGLAACRITDNGPYWFNGYGLANIETDTPVEVETLFMLASISKTITATALMQLWEDGLFELDDDVNEYLPFPVVNPWHEKVPITIRMLLTHTSSINDNWSIMPYYLGDSPIALGDYLDDYLSPTGENYDPDNNYNGWAPGTTWDYCNTAIALAGYLVELLSGQPFDQYCRQQIFLPLRMYETAWHLADLHPAHIAMPYYWDGSDFLPYGHYGYSDYPSGQLRTSVDQLGRFLAAYINGGEYQGARILETATVNMMLTLQIPAVNTFQGLVWRKMGTAWGHGGGDLGVNTTMYFEPAMDRGVVVFTNGMNGSVTGNVADAVLNYSALEPTTLRLDVDPDLLSWKPPADALRYDVVRGDLVALRESGGDFVAATEACEADDRVEMELPFLLNPDPQQAWWFLARRVTDSENGSYDSEQPSQVESRDDEILYSGDDCP
jgi:CubicO group peptidase (beta-lactamase class C family)